MTLDELVERQRKMEMEIQDMLAEFESVTGHQFIVSKIELERVLLLDQRKPWLLGVKIILEG